MILVKFGTDFHSTENSSNTLIEYVKADVVKIITNVKRAFYK